MLPFIMLILALVCGITWYKEPRIFLLIFHRMAFPIRKGNPLHIDKELNFPGSLRLEKNWLLLFMELKAVLDRSKPLPKFHEVDRANYKISFEDGPAWRTLVLKAYDGWFADNCKMFPQTCKLLSDLSDVSTVMFSILEPHVKIPEHTGKFSGIWRYHLALQVPAAGLCFIEVNGEKYFWKEGEGILFNDTYLHSVNNDTDGYRIILFLDITKRSSKFVRAINKCILYLIKESPIFKKATRTGNVYDL